MNASNAVKRENAKGMKENERKWGLPLMKAGWTLLPDVILDFQSELKLDAKDINIIMHLARMWWYADRLPYPSKARLAKAIKCHPSTIQRHIRKMEERGLIRRIGQKDEERGQTTNKYDLDGLIRLLTPLAKEVVAKRELTRKERESGRKRRSSDGSPELKVVHGGRKPR